MVCIYNRDYLVFKILQLFIEDYIGFVIGECLLDLMIYNGKKLYLREFLLFYVLDLVLLEMIFIQVEWLQENEFNIWLYFIENELLYFSEFCKI